MSEISSKYKKFIQAQEWRKHDCDNLKLAIEDFKIAIDNIQPGTVKQSDIDKYNDKYNAMVQDYNIKCKKGTIVTIGKRKDNKQG